MSKSYASALLMETQTDDEPIAIQDKSQFIVSYGIACARKNQSSGNYEILMIKKRATYAFVDFIRGRYNPENQSELAYTFNQMTINEKIMIKSCNFDTIWNYCWGRSPEKPSEKGMYNRSSKKFKELVSMDNGEKIDNLIKRSTHGELLWEIPKGRIHKNELPLQTAIREFEEETGVKPDAYQLLPDEGTIEYTFTDNNVKYKYIYYLAIINRSAHPRYDFNNEHMILEVVDIKFLPATAVQQFNNNRLHQTVRIIIKKLKKYF